MEAVLWITNICIGLRKSQAKTLADLVAVAVPVGRVSLSELGPLLAEERDGVAKHGIKRVWRFTANDRIRPNPRCLPVFGCGPAILSQHERKHLPTEDRRRMAEM